jgi:hypothetical protein
MELVAATLKAHPVKVWLDKEVYFFCSDAGHQDSLLFDKFDNLFSVFFFSAVRLDPFIIGLT